MRALRAAFRVITRVEEACLSLSILAMATLTIANVFLRAAFGESLLFTQEVNRFLIVLVTFMGVGYGASQGRHIRMTAFYDMMSDRGRKATMLLITASTSALLFTFTWLSVSYLVGTLRVLGGASPVLHVPLYLLYLAAPIGLFLGAVQYLLAFVRNLRSPEVYVAFDRLDGYDEPPLDV